MNKPIRNFFPRRFLSPEEGAEPIYHTDSRYGYASYEEIIVEDSIEARLSCKPDERIKAEYKLSIRSNIQPTQ